MTDTEENDLGPGPWGWRSQHPSRQSRIFRSATVTWLTLTVRRRIY